jgi:hypothetical protein
MLAVVAFGTKTAEQFILTSHKIHSISVTTRSSGKKYFAYFPYISHLFEVLEPNLME